MREIKFRVFDGEDMRVVEKQNYLGFTGLVDQIVHHEDAKWLQYTGIKDKNDVEIYEGDIVEADVGDGYLTKHKIIFELGRFTMEDLESGSRCLWILSGKCEVIGNIYENPELLNQ